MSRRILLANIFNRDSLFPTQAFLLKEFGNAVWGNRENKLMLEKSDYKKYFSNAERDRFLVVEDPSEAAEKLALFSETNPSGKVFVSTGAELSDSLLQKSAIDEVRLRRTVNKNTGIIGQPFLFSNRDKFQMSEKYLIACSPVETVSMEKWLKKEE